MNLRKSFIVNNKVVKPVLLFLYREYWEIVQRILGDRMYIRYIYRRNFHRPIDLDNPRTFNEKLNWMKLNYHNPLFNTLADKELVKDFVRGRIGEEYVVPSYGVWKSFGDIDFDKLPGRFVLKATHDSSGAVVCKDRRELDFAALKEKYDRLMKRNWFLSSREWVYKDLEPKIIVDELLDDGSGRELRDYKFWCFNGVPAYMYITNKGDNIEENYYDMDFNPVTINHGFPRTSPEYSRPGNFDTMRRLAAELSAGIPFVRVDFFDVGGQVYFGEFTFYDWAGFRPFSDYEWDKKLGDLIALPDKMI